MFCQVVGAEGQGPLVRGICVALFCTLGGQFVLAGLHDQPLTLYIEQLSRPWTEEKRAKTGFPA